MKLDLYFARLFTKTLFGVLLVFCLILAFVEIVEQMRKLGGTSASFGEIIQLTFLRVPASLYDILPLTVILATIALFLGLARSSEMVVTRAAGRSALRALLPPTLVAVIFGISCVAILNPIVAATSKQYEARVDQLLGKSSDLTLSDTGLWLRQGDQNAQTVIHAAKANLDGTELSNVTFLTFKEEVGPIARIEARLAVLKDQEWVAYDVKTWPLEDVVTPEAQATTYDELSIPSTLTATEIRDSFGTPSSIPIWDLPAFIERLRAAGFSAQRHDVWFQMELALPVFFVAMVMIGAAFTLRHQRGGRTGMMVLFAILLSFAIYFLRNFAQVLGENGQLPAILAAWAPPLAAIGLSIGVLLHNEDG